MSFFSWADTKSNQVIEGYVEAMRLIGGGNQRPVVYPRWVRRIYILGWPVLMPLRFAVLIVMLLIAGIALALFALVVVILFVGMWAGLTLWEKIEEGWA